MRKTRSVAVAVVASVMYCLSLSAAVAKDEAVKIENAPKAKDEAVKTGTAVKANAETVKTGTAAKANAEAVKTGTASKLKNDAGKLHGASKLFKEIASIPKMKIPPVLITNASAIVIVPGAAKNDFMVKGRSAGGLLLTRDKEGKWSSPVFITLSGGTLGWQIVSEPMDIVLVCKNSKAVDAIIKGKLTLDAKSSIGQGWLGLNLKGATAKDLKAEISSYVRSRRVFVEDAPVAGASLQVDAVANDAFYGKSKVAAADILSGKVTKESEDVKALQKLLANYAAIK